MEPAVSLRAVTKTFGDMTALREVELHVPRGGLYGLIGPNGAGKTTSIRIIMSILFPDRGEVSVLGHRSALDAKDRIGYLPEERGVYRRMKVGAFLTYMAGLKGVSSRLAHARMLALLERVDLPGTDRKRCDELSKGMLQRVQLVASLIHEPDLLILDEPFSGLDPVSTRLLRDLVLERHRQGVTILFSTHAMAQAEELCEHVVMIHRGSKVLDEPTAALRRFSEPRTILFEPMEAAADVAPLRALPGVARVQPRPPAGAAGGVLNATATATASAGVARVAHVADAAIAAGAPRGAAPVYEIALAPGADPGEAIRRITMTVTPGRIELARVRLEDIFVQIVSGGSGGSTPSHADDAEAARLREELRAPETDTEGAAV